MFMAGWRGIKTRFLVEKKFFKERLIRLSAGMVGTPGLFLLSFPKGLVGKRARQRDIP
jgi:hypothetical protein